MPLNGKVQLIAYPDRIGHNLADLADFLEQDLGDAVGGVHILPPYPSNADGGFAPLTHKQIDPAYGGWAEIERIAAQRDICVDLILNHLSDESPEFLDFLAHGKESPSADLFIDVDALGEITSDDMAKIYIRKEKEPFREVTFADGSKGRVWCTFTEHQIDLDYTHPHTFAYMRDTIAFLAERGIRMLRLDAFGYVCKKVGSSCFLVEPEVWRILGWFQQTAAEYDITLLPEIHDHYSYQYPLARGGMKAYGFALPLLVLYALLDNNSKPLKQWLRMCPRDQVTVLDTHDGICIPDVEGLLPEADIQALIQNVSSRSADPILRRSAVNVHSVGAIYQMTCTFYDALLRNDDSFVAARAIQLFSPGIPQVYYVGLLAGCNDDELVEKTGEARDINRHYYELEEARQSLSSDLSQRQLHLMRLRSTHPAFEGEFELFSSNDNSVDMGWRHGEHYCRVFVDLSFHTTTVTCSGSEEGEAGYRV